MTSAARTRIKICGIKDARAAGVAADAGADLVGLVLAPDSPRRLTRVAAEEIAATLPAHVTPVAVFRDAALDQVLAWTGDSVQVHGEASEAMIRALHDADRRVIRGVRFDPDAVARWGSCDAVSMLLVDGSTGGAGRGFDHASLASMMSAITRPIILAGGLSPENVGQAIALVRPWAVDVSSGVESAPGVKDPRRIEAFCHAVRRADEALQAG